MTTLPEAAARIRVLLKEIPEERSDASRLDELRRTFAVLIADDEFDPNQPFADTTSTASLQWQSFLHKSHTNMVRQLCDRIQSGRQSAIRALFGVISASPRRSANGQSRMLSTDLLVQFIRAMIQLPNFDKAITHMLKVEFIGPFRDVQYYIMVALTICANQLYQSSEPVEECAGNLMHILTMIPIAESQDELDCNAKFLIPPPTHIAPVVGGDGSSDSDPANISDDGSVESADNSLGDTRKKRPPEQRFLLQKISAHHRVWSKAWLALLRLPLTGSATRETLLLLPERVLPLVANPLQFSDFLMSSYRHLSGDDVIPIMSLESLFILMTRHGLECPDFYKHLYALITPGLCHFKYRPRFFALLDKCLSRNEMMPARLVAAFMKRLLRCCLTAPPSSILFVLALVSNLLRRHPETNCLIHRTQEDDTGDPYNANTDDPSASHALESSLWELVALSRHYHPAVVTLADAVGGEFEMKAPMHSLQDFLGHSYRSLFEQERKRKRKNTPLTFVSPSKLFTDDDVFAHILDKS